MMDFFDSLSNARDDEIEGLVALESAEIAAEKACLSYGFARDLQDLKNAEAELKWYAESGEAEDLIGYYEAAKTAETEEKTESLLAKAWAAIKNLFEKIKNAIFKKNVEPPKDPKAKIKVPKPFALICKKLKSAWNAVKSAVISGKKKLSENGNWKKLLIILGVVGLAGAGVAAHNAKKNSKDPGTAMVVSNTQIHKLTDDEVEIVAGEIESARGVAVEMVDTIAMVSDKTAKNPRSQVADNVDQFKLMSAPLKSFGNMCNRYMAQANKTMALPGPVAGKETNGGGSSKKDIEEALSKMGNQKLSRLVQRGMVAQKGNNEWNRKKNAWKPQKLDKTAAINKIKEYISGGYLKDNEIFAMESVDDMYFELDMDGFMESNYGDDFDDFGTDSFLENL